MQALVKIGATQYLVSPGMELNVPNLDRDSGELVLDQVLLLLDDKSTQIGQPFVPHLKVVADILGPVKGKKIKVTKFKAKSRYDKTVGFRPKYTRIKINKISVVKSKLDNREK